MDQRDQSVNKLVQDDPLTQRLSAEQLQHERCAEVGLPTTTARPGWASSTWDHVGIFWDFSCGETSSYTILESSVDVEKIIGPDVLFFLPQHLEIM